MFMDNPTNEENPMTTTPPAPPAESTAKPVTAHYKEPDWFTRHVFNYVVKGLTRLGVSVWGSRVLEHKGRTSGELHHVPVNLLTIDGTQYLVSPRGRPSGCATCATLAATGADPGTSAPALHGQGDPGGRGRARPAGLPPPLEVRVGMFFDGVTPDSTDAEWAAVAAKHPVFELS